MSIGKAYLSFQRLGYVCMEFMNEATDLFSVLGICKSLGTVPEDSIQGVQFRVCRWRRSWLSSTARGMMGSYEPAPKAGSPGTPICDLTKK